MSQRDLRDDTRSLATRGPQRRLQQRRRRRPASRHLYGAVDLGAGPQGFCALARQARNHGFAEILGPGYPGHDDHTHIAARSGRFWSAPSCGI